MNVRIEIVRDEHANYWVRYSGKSHAFKTHDDARSFAEGVQQDRGGEDAAQIIDHITE
ncbi:hypothetical protein [Rhizobium sp. AC44/96]|uniref:hypothetical protein n=1 Tax=Rhizobium sp. AC44/96 TaxID=1841654 RepID=UPI00130195BE|nr:hypothetical protein [Rhizobium sp. AC44/96]